MRKTCNHCRCFAQRLRPMTTIVPFEPERSIIEQYPVAFWVLSAVISVAGSVFSPELRRFVVSLRSPSKKLANPSIDTGHTGGSWHGYINLARSKWGQLVVLPLIGAVCATSFLAFDHEADGAPWTDYLLMVGFLFAVFSFWAFLLRLMIVILIFVWNDVRRRR
jgi:hypothetical protein